MKSDRKLREFYTFGIYGRDFNLDDSETDEPDTAGIVKVSSVLIVLLAAFATFSSLI
jgi:hypothetical protein